MLSSWIDPIAERIAGAGYRIVVLHTTSLNLDSAPPVDVDRDYDIVEISGWNFDDLHSYLQSALPAAVVMFTFRSLIDILLIRVCRQLRIPSLYVQHGFFINTKYVMANKRASVARYRRYLRWYGRFLARNKPPEMLKEVATALRAVTRVDYTHMSFDASMFFAKAGFDDAAQFFDFPRDRVFFSGYPIAPTRERLQEMRSRQVKTKRAVYIHQPFVRDRFTHLTADEEIVYLRSLGAACRSAGYELVFRPHPRESAEHYSRELQGADIEVDTARPTTEAIADASVVLGQFSTTLFTAILLEKPVVIVDYPGLAEDYYRLFEPVATRVSDAAGLRAVLATPAAAASTGALEGFRDRFVGSQNNYQHRAETLLSIVEKMVDSTLTPA